MTRIARTAPFAALLGIDRKTKSKPPAAPKPASRAKAKAKSGDDKPAFAHLLATPATTRSITPAQRAEMRGAVAREVVAAYADSRRAVAQAGARQTAPSGMTPDADRDLAAKIVAAGRRRRGEI